MSTEQDFQTKDIPAEVKDIPRFDPNPNTAEPADITPGGPLSIDYGRTEKFPGERPAFPGASPAEPSR